jgi:hypothetical protein
MRVSLIRPAARLALVVMVALFLNGRRRQASRSVAEPRDGRVEPGTRTGSDVDGRPPQRESRRGRLSEYLSKHPNTQLAWIGYRIFKWLLLVTAVIFAMLVAFAVLTFPTDVPVSVPEAERFQALQDARVAWVAQLKDLGQAFLLTPVFPLLAAVLGYIFGVSGPAERPTAEPPPEGRVPSGSAG